MRMHTLLFAITTALATSALAGCADEIDETFDCTQICERYSDCFDADYDVGSCVDRCEDNADADEDFADHADACETCLDDKSCTGSFECVDECVGIVP